METENKSATSGNKAIKCFINAGCSLAGAIASAELYIYGLNIHDETLKYIGFAGFALSMASHIYNFVRFDTNLRDQNKQDKLEKIINI